MENKTLRIAANPISKHLCTSLHPPLHPIRVWVVRLHTTMGLKYFIPSLSLLILLGTALKYAIWRLVGNTNAAKLGAPTLSSTIPCRMCRDHKPSYMAYAYALGVTERIKYTIDSTRLQRASCFQFLTNNSFQLHEPRGLLRCWLCIYMYIYVMCI